ncbi:hypothetical protein BZG29_07590 [Janthinobacterium sp. LM6]|uniref:hypothetical protein n=1 Tax=Janthinobacterium sp. LM6 TaxID=1938606 RepID=UPI000983E704|nr:hypothetical protein [Janthinobacterium sp. LM6]AQR68236.1 hypothetical protein BZG29_07590 [Janthinobacterium sp. LM6]
MKIARLLSSSFLVLAVALVAYGLFGLSRFAWYTGAYYDERMILFDHGFYPFAWGIALLMGQIARLHHRRPAMLLAAGAALVLLLWKRATVPDGIANQQLFPGPDLLEGLIVTAVVVIVLALIDRPVEQAIRKAFRRTR